MDILEPNRPSEFEIQAMLFTELKRLGFNVRGEVAVPYSNDGKRKQTCRFDLATFSNGRLSGILEVKPSVTKHKREGGWRATRQGARYHNFGVPVRIVYGMADAQRLIADIESGAQLFF